MITQAYLEFVKKLLEIDKSDKILELYKYYLNKYDDFKRYSFIVGTNDKTGAVDNPLIRKYRHEPNQDTLYSIKNGLKETSQTMDLFTIDILNSYKYFMVLRSDFKEQFRTSLNITLDANVVSFIAKFIENNEIDTNVFRSKDDLLFFEPFIQDIFKDRIDDVNIFCYIAEILSHKQYDSDLKTDKLYSNIENLCKFKSLDLEYFNQTGILKYDVKNFKNMYGFFRNNLNNFEINIGFNYIYFYFILAIISKNSKDFDIKKSIKHIFDYMQENGTNFSELLEFILDYFEHGSNGFMNINERLKKINYEEAVKDIKNMCWDITYYYSMREVLNLNNSHVKEDFIFPIYITKDKKFTQNYIALFKNKIIVYKDNKFIGIARQESELTKRLMDYIGNPTKDFQREKISDLQEYKDKSEKLAQQANNLLKKIFTK
ncbi:hypothetical protein AVANS14531_07795 [Campylobacter sp. Cr9]|uniref:hypothetical protein n=1 Tax=Campylobacter sp. Cr9 TaxID=2735728 RepID=UPI0030152E58|nr:hypothetical protein [Campylobacter sp. Cr9]